MSMTTRPEELTEEAATNGGGPAPVDQAHARAMARATAYKFAGRYQEGGARAPHLHPAGCEVRIDDADAGRVSWPKDREKFAIVGFSESTRLKAPYDDPSWVIAGLNQLVRYIPRADIWFEVHQREVWTADIVRGTDYVSWLRECPMPVIMESTDYDLGLFRDIPNAVRFPIEATTNFVGDIRRPDGTIHTLDYYESTIALQIAWAVWAGFKEIGIWGVDLIIGEEWDYQKPNAEFWLGFCQGRGVKLTIPDESALLRGMPHRYGHKPAGMGPFSLAFFNTILVNAKAKHEELLTAVNNVEGAMNAIRNMRDAAMIYQRGGKLKDIESIKAMGLDI